MNEQYIDTIHRYLGGKMDVAEREAFEADMQRDPTLQNDVEFERILLAGLEKAGEQEQRQTIGSVHAKLKSGGFFENAGADMRVIHRSNKISMNRILAIAASLVVLIGAVWFFAIRNTVSDPEALFAKFYQPEIEVQRAQSLIAELRQAQGLAGVPTDSDSLKTALELYEDGKYSESLELLKALAVNDPANDAVQYYIGVIHMSQERYAKAIEVLIPISRLDDSEFQNDALWNLGLCYLKTENGQQDAYQAFQTLADDPAFDRHRNAKALKEQLLPK